MSTVSCRSGEKKEENPLLDIEAWETPYRVPPFDRIRPEHYLPAFERAMAIHDAEIDAIVTNNDAPDFRNVIEAYDDAGRMLEEVALIFEMVSSADMTDQLMAVQENVMPRLAAHSDRIGMNAKLFEKVKSVYDQRLSLSLEPDQLRLVEKIYTEFVRSGALLGDADKARLQEINEALSLASVEFGRHLLAENDRYRLLLGSDELEGLPTGVRETAMQAAREIGEEGKYLFTLSQPSMIPLLTYSSRRDLREQIYKAYLRRGNQDDDLDNKRLIADFIRLRSEKARLLGFESYADYVLAEQMARTPRAAYELLDEIWTPALERAGQELAEMQPLLEADIPGATFESWDWWYYAEKLRKKNYALDQEMLRPYFSLENVRSGIFFLANRLYGITFRPVNVPLYNEECSAFEVLDADSSHLGVLYFDLFPRAGKGSGAWCGYFRAQSYRDGERVDPVVGIVCNFPRLAGSAPSLLTADDVETLFHEFGHALHFLFHDVKYRSLADVEGDFVELPSQIMENWAFEPEMLEQYATHYRTNDPIRDDRTGCGGPFRSGYPLADVGRRARRERLRAPGAGRAARTDPADRAPLPLHLFPPHLRRRLLGRLLFLSLGRTARSGRFRLFPSEPRPLRPDHRRPVPPRGAGAGRRGRRHDPLSQFPRRGALEDPHAPQPRPVDRTRTRAGGGDRDARSG